MTEPVHTVNSPTPKSSGSLHILTLTPFYPTDRDDASGCFIAEPLTALQKIGIRNTVFAAQPIYRGSFHNAASAVPANWVRYFSLPGGFGLPSAGAFLFAGIVGKLRELHRSQPVDLIHAHGPLPCGHAAMLIAEELHIPYVVSVHGLDAFSDVQVRGRAGIWCRRIAQRTYRASRRVICISEHVREQVLDGVGRSCQTSVVYNGVAAALFQPSANGTDSSVILSVGNLIPIKGHDVLIRAMPSVTSEFPDVTLEIIGDGPEGARLQALAKELRIAERVKFLGRRSRREVAAAMHRCTLFVLPSRYEGLGCVYLEAMCAGKAVIGCRGQGIAEIIHHGSNGFLVGPDNEKELEIALGMLLRDEQQRHNLERAARDTVLDRLTLECQAENFARVYRECVRERAT